MPTGLRFL